MMVISDIWKGEILIREINRQFILYKVLDFNTFDYLLLVNVGLTIEIHVGGPNFYQFCTTELSVKIYITVLSFFES